MIDRLAELNRLLIATTTIAPSGEMVTQAAVLRQCESIVIESIFPDHSLSILFGEKIGFVKTKAESVCITNLGNEFMSLNPTGIYDLTTDQKQMLIRNYYLSGYNHLATLKLFECFTKEYAAKTFQWSSVDSSPLQCAPWLVEHLIQLGVIQRREYILDVTPEYVDAVAALLTETKGWTPESLNEHLLERKEIGEIAEEIVLNYEKERVRKEGGKVECLCINQISKLKPDAGYDIESFDGKSGIIPNRFIEVKGAKGTNPRFFLSENEIKVAKRLKDNYWIYFVGGVDTKTRTAKKAPIMYKNLEDAILLNHEFNKTPNGLVIERIVDTK